jgi:hypothetical protein
MTSLPSRRSLQRHQGVIGSAEHVTHRLERPLIDVLSATLTPP